MTCTFVDYVLKGKWQYAEEEEAYRARVPAASWAEAAAAGTRRARAGPPAPAPCLLRHTKPLNTGTSSRFHTRARARTLHTKIFTTSEKCSKTKL